MRDYGKFNKSFAHSLIPLKVRWAPTASGGSSSRGEGCGCGSRASLLLRPAPAKWVAFALAGLGARVRWSVGVPAARCSRAWRCLALPCEPRAISCSFGAFPTGVAPGVRGTLPQALAPALCLPAGRLAPSRRELLYFL